MSSEVFTPLQVLSVTVAIPAEQCLVLVLQSRVGGAAGGRLYHPAAELSAKCVCAIYPLRGGFLSGGAAAL